MKTLCTLLLTAAVLALPLTAPAADEQKKPPKLETPVLWIGDSMMRILGLGPQGVAPFIYFQF